MPPLNQSLAAHMPPETPFSLKDIIGLVADLMALFGLSGFFTWAFVKKSLNSLEPAEIGVSVFAMAVKAFLSIFVLAALLVPGFFLHMIVIMILSGSYMPSEALWSERKSVLYVASYVLNALWFIPLSILSVSSVFAWSLNPFQRFWHAFTRK